MISKLKFLNNCMVKVNKQYLHVWEEMMCNMLLSIVLHPKVRVILYRKQKS